MCKFNSNCNEKGIETIKKNYKFIQTMRIYCLNKQKFTIVITFPEFKKIVLVKNCRVKVNVRAKHSLGSCIRW